MIRPSVARTLAGALLWCAATPLFAGFSGTDLILASVGRGPGASSSQWTTTVWIHNPSASTATIQVMFLERKQANPSPVTVSVSVAAGDTVRYANILADLFSFDNKFGALRFVSDQKIVVACRIFNLPAGGTDRDTQGQDYAGIPSSFGISKGQSTQLLGVYQTSTDKSVSPFRYSFGLTETAGGTASVHVKAFDGTGAVVAEKDYGPLGAYEVEYYPIEDLSPSIASTNLRLEVSMTNGTGKVIAVGSGVANQSNDGTTFEMQFADSLLGGGGGGLSAVSHDLTLTGDGTPSNPLGLANDSVTKVKLAASGGTNGQVLGTDGSNLLWLAAGGGGSGVPSVNGITSAVTINGTGAATVSTTASTITVNSPTSLPPSGAAGGDLTGGYPNPYLKLPYSGTATSSGIAFGVTNTGSGYGLFGFSDTNYGVYGGSTSSHGVSGRSTSGYGVYGATTSGIGVVGSTFGSGDGVYGGSFSGYGVYGESGSGYGVHGKRGNYEGFLGYSDGGVFGSNGVGNFGYLGLANGPNIYAGYFSGNVSVSGTLSKGGGAFKIDHPLDPENKYLYHSFVESPDMKNIYDGVVVTDAAGEAVVELPAWFEALNRDFRYQLTVIGQFAQAIVAQEIEHDRFAIKTNLANVKVSWQVTGVRKDPFANANRIPVEEDKPAAERGFYLHPAAWGQPIERDVESARHPDLMRKIKEDKGVERR